MTKQNKKRKCGFTLVELLVVIAILAILATVSVVGYTAFIQRAHESNAKTEAAQIRELIMAQVISGENFELGSNSTTYYAVVPEKDTSGAISYKIYSGTKGENATEPTYSTEVTTGTISILTPSDDLAKVVNTENKSSLFIASATSLNYVVTYDNKTITVKIDLTNLNGELSANTTTTETE